MRYLHVDLTIFWALEGRAVTMGILDLGDSFFAFLETMILMAPFFMASLIVLRIVSMALSFGIPSNETSSILRIRSLDLRRPSYTENMKAQ